MSGKSVKSVKVVCQHCGEDFLVAPWRRLKAKYCSYDCSNKARTTSKAYSKPRTCVRCGAGFLPTHWNQKHCGRQCWADSVRKRKRIPCHSCGKEFSQTRVAQKYCSRKCSEPFNKKTTRFKKEFIDILWANLVKLIAGEKCEYCGKADHLNSHHIFSRSNMALRWDTQNGICLCAGHHVLSNFSAHKAPLEFAEWLKETRGESWYQTLVTKSRTIVKLTDGDRSNITVDLKQRIAEQGV